MGKEKIEGLKLPEIIWRMSIGGIGLGAKILLDEVPAVAEWDDSENRLMIAIMANVKCDIRLTIILSSTMEQMSFIFIKNPSVRF